MEFSDGSTRRMCYCVEKGCNYALAAILPPSDTGEEEGEERAIQLYVKSAHNHHIKPRGVREGPAAGGFQLVKCVGSLEEVETLKQKMKQRFTRSLAKGKRRYHRCGQHGCPIQMMVEQVWGEQEASRQDGSMEAES